MRRILTSWPVILVSGAAFLAIGYGFSLYMPQTGEPILDTLASQSDVLARLEAMDDSQKAAHIEMTLLLDMLYPIAYAVLLGGLAMKAFPKAGWWLAVPAFLGCSADLIENMIQLMALQGNTSLLGLKAILTPAKFILLVIAVLLVVVCGLTAGIAALRRRRSA
ncbi:MAG: hypothetical protein AAF950_06570 [Pseudomonadota bacterium]